MLKRLTTIWLLLVFSALPAAAQVYQVAELICAAIEQAHDDEETMTCCIVAVQCQMNMHKPPQYAAATDCPSQCVCVPSEPVAPMGLLNIAPKLPIADEAPTTISPATRWTEFLPTNSLEQFRPPPKTPKTYLRHTCLRI